MLLLVLGQNHMLSPLLSKSKGRVGEESSRQGLGGQVVNNINNNNNNNEGDKWSRGYRDERGSFMSV